VLGDIVKDKAEDIVKHVSTPNVATDMLRIVNAMGIDKLQYWGFSCV